MTVLCYVVDHAGSGQSTKELGRKKEKKKTKFIAERSREKESLKFLTNYL